MNYPNEEYFLKLSFGIHIAVFIFIFSLIYFFRPIVSNNELVEFRVIEKPAEIKISKVLPLKSVPIPTQVKKKRIPKKKKRKVFGANKNIIRSNNSAALKTKMGNTIAKKVDNKILKKSDEEALPIPKDEYLVTQMPRVISEFRQPYPPEAKKKGIEGKVVLEILIDQNGRVRKAEVINGPGFGLNEAAKFSIMKFKFKPAMIGEQKVSVVIRYGINFVLEE